MISGGKSDKDTVLLFKGQPYGPFDERIKSRVPLIPLSLISLASPLLPEGYKVKIIDQSGPIENIFESLKGILDKVICVGISALTGNEITEGIAFSRVIKEHNADIPIIWGGWHVSVFCEESIKNAYVDIVVKGLGQRIFLDLVNCISKSLPLANVNGIYYKEQGRIVKTKEADNLRLEELPLPAFEMLDLDHYREQSLALRQKPIINNLEITGYLYYVTSFGCPNECAYCCSESVFGRRMYRYDIGKVADQIKWLVEEKQFNSIGFMDANFFINMDRVENFCRLILKKKINFAWDAQMYVRDILRYEQKSILSLLRESGCFRVNIGSESGSQEVLEYIKKHIKVEEILTAARILNKHKIEAAFNFLFGLPRMEDKKQIYESFKLAAELKKINTEFSFPVSFYVPFPGTKMYGDAVTRGLRIPDNLEGWGSFNTYYDKARGAYPWKPDRFQRLVSNVMTFYIPLAFPGTMYRGTLTRIKEKMNYSNLRLFIKLGHFLASIRIKHSFYYCPFEVFIFRIYRFFSRAPIYQAGGKYYVSKTEREVPS